MNSARTVRSNSCGGAAAALAGISNWARGSLIFSYGLFSIAAQTLLFREFITTFEGNDISVGIFFGSWFLWVGLGAILVYRAKAFAEILLRNIEFLFLSYLPAFILELLLTIEARQLAGVESYVLLPIRTILLLSIIVNAPVSIITGMLFPIACRWVAPVRNSITSNHTAQEGKTSNGLGPPCFLAKARRGAVSRVYILEAAGSFCGGLGTTILLGAGFSLARVFLILAFIVSVPVSWVQLGKAKRWIWAVMPVCILACLLAGADRPVMQQVRIIKWAKLFPGDVPYGAFQTAQAEYLYGAHHGQWVAVREGSTCETLPDHESAGRVAAIGLCQNPDAQRVLVVGSGLGLCYELLRLPQIERVTWAHCDSEYVQQVGNFVPAEFKISDRRFDRVAGDIRSLLAQKKRYYDIVILDLPEATSSVLNRYYTLEFYRQVKESLRADGVLAVRVAGGENIMGTELINLGASTKLTLAKVFSRLVLTPGEDTWFIASNSENTTGDPASLRDRFAKIEGAADVFSPQALLSVYLPDRAQAALENYARADLPERLLINRDSRPLTHLYSLLLAAKQSGTPVTRFVKYLALAGPSAFIIPLLIFIILRVTYVTSRVMRRASFENLNKIHNTQYSILNTSFDSSFLVFSAGWIGIGVVIVLMYLYQTRFGSLYLHIGVISSLFMVGLTAGAAIISRILGKDTRYQTRTTNELLLFAVITVHTLVLAAIAFWPAERWTETVNTINNLWEPAHAIFAGAFVLCGLCAGCYFPIAAKRLSDSGFEIGLAGSKLATADHIGASVGGMVTSLALVPVLGTKLTLFVFVILILANTPPAALRILMVEQFPTVETTAFRLRRLGYILFGVGASVVLCSNLLAAAGARLRPSLPLSAAQALAGELRLERASAVLGDSARKLDYFKVYKRQANLEEPAEQAEPNRQAPNLEAEKLIGYIFSSEDLAGEVRGFGGKMNLAIYVDVTGSLANFHIIRSNETPSYLEMLGEWRGSLNGRQLFQPQPFADVHAVTGATISSEAILSALQISGHRFATQILGQTIVPQVQEGLHRAKYLPDAHGTYLIGAFVLTLLVIYYGGFWSRLAVLLLNLAVGGIWLNTQYSSEQIMTLLSLHSPALRLTGVFLLVVAVPLLVIIFGNIYCGYICPFGAAQELLGYVVPERFKQPIPAERMRKARFVKYAVLFIFVTVFFLSRNRTMLSADPLISVFNLQFSTADFRSAMLLITAAALIGSIFYARFWCRYLCPVGAFLSLLNNVVILKRFLPTKKFGRCEFGLTAKDQMDCIYCDRCRYQAKAAVRKEPLLRPDYAQMKPLSRFFMVGVLAVAILVSTVSVSRFLQVTGTSLDYSATFAPSGGQPRDVDMQRIRDLIEQNKLSDREAEFYKKLD